MEQIVNMIVRQVMRRFVNLGINKSINAFSGKKPSKGNRDEQPPRG